MSIASTVARAHHWARTFASEGDPLVSTAKTSMISNKQITRAWMRVTDPHQKSAI
jgi:hypothetical protein